MLQRIMKAALIIMVCSLACASVSASIKTTFNETKPPRLVADELGILWVERKPEKLHPGALARRLSQREPYFVIFVPTTAEYRDRAINHAIKLKEWFEAHPKMPDQIDIVAYNSPHNTYFNFQINGIHYRHEKFAPKGIMGVPDSLNARENAVLDYLATLELMKKGTFDSFEIGDLEVVRDPS